MTAKPQSFTKFLKLNEGNPRGVGTAARLWRDDKDPRKPTNPESWDEIAFYFNEIIDADDEYFIECDLAWKMWENFPAKATPAAYTALASDMENVRPVVSKMAEQFDLAYSGDPEIDEATGELLRAFYRVRRAMEAHMARDYPEIPLDTWKPYKKRIAP